MSTHFAATALEVSMPEPTISAARVWTGRVLTGLTLVFFAFDAIMKLVKPAPVVDASVNRLGFPESTLVGIGIVLLLSTALYCIPRTAAFGALLLTAYLGGAVAANVRVQTPLFNNAFPILFAVILWSGLALRDRRIAALVPFASN
jgi:hypothetical protein